MLYLLGTAFIGRFGKSGYPIGYTLVAVLVAISIFVLCRNREIFKPHWKVLPGVGLGLLGIAAWILLSKLHLERYVTDLLPTFLKPPDRAGYNPFEELGTGLQAWAFVAVRLIGIAILVPIAEELFWRGFLLRWLIDPEWERVPLGDYTLSSCAIVTFMFTLAHPEWLAAAVYCLLINALLYWKRDLWQCMVAHATSNFALAVYVLMTAEWWLW